MTTHTSTPRRGSRARTLEIAVVGGPVDGFRPRIRDAARHVDTGRPGSALIAFALLGHGRFQPLRTDSRRGYSAPAAAPVASPIDARTVEVYAFTGYREEARRFLPARRVPVFAHVDTRPLRLTRDEGRTVIAVG